MVHKQSRHQEYARKVWDYDASPIVDRSEHAPYYTKQKLKIAH